MKVSQLQRFLNDLELFVAASGASAKVLTDLGKASACLTTFAHMPIEDFASFLTVAEEYHRTGSIPSIIKPSTRKPATPKVQKLTGPEGIQTAVDHYNAFYEKAARRELTNELIDAEMTWLDAMLDAKTLLKVAKVVGVKKAITSKKDALKALQNRALSSFESAINTSFA